MGVQDRSRPVKLLIKASGIYLNAQTRRSIGFTADLSGNDKTQF